jgi:tetratricopeptide (TPR) repeat protein
MLPVLGLLLMLQQPAQTIRLQVEQAERTAVQQRAAQDDRGAAVTLLGAGVMLRKAGLYEESGIRFKTAVALDPASSRTWYNFGLHHQQRNQPALALESFQKSIAANPLYHYAHFGAASIYAQADGMTEVAVQEYEQAIALVPTFYQALNNLGLLKSASGALDEAHALLKRTVRIQPAFPEALNNLGTIQHNLRWFNKALRSFRKCVKVQPTFGPAYNNIGLVLKDMGQRSLESLDAFQQSVQLQPYSIEALSHLANTQFKLLQVDEATAAYRAAFALDRTKLHLLGKMAHTQQFSCDWDGFAQSWPQLLHTLRAGQYSCLMAFEALAMPLSAELLLAVARSHAGDPSPAFNFRRRRLSAGGYSRGGGGGGDGGDGESSSDIGHGSESDSRGFPRMRVAYVSSDFTRHPIMTVAGGIFEAGAHNMSSFETFCYSLSYSHDGSDEAFAVSKGVDHFMPLLANVSTTDAATHIFNGSYPHVSIACFMPHIVLCLPLTSTHFHSLSVTFSHFQSPSLTSTPHCSRSLTSTLRHSLSLNSTLPHSA